MLQFLPIIYAHYRGICVNSKKIIGILFVTAFGFIKPMDNQKVLSLQELSLISLLSQQETRRHLLSEDDTPDIPAHILTLLKDKVRVFFTKQRIFQAICEACVCRKSYIRDKGSIYLNNRSSQIVTYDTYKNTLSIRGDLTSLTPRQLQAIACGNYIHSYLNPVRLPSNYQIKEVYDSAFILANDSRLDIRSCTRCHEQLSKRKEIWIYDGPPGTHFSDLYYYESCQ